MTGKIRHIRQACRNTEPIENHFGFTPEGLERLDPFATGEAFGARIAVAQDHVETISTYTRYVKSNDAFCFDNRI